MLQSCRRARKVCSQMSVLSGSSGADARRTLSFKSQYMYSREQLSNWKRMWQLVTHHACLSATLVHPLQTNRTNKEGPTFLSGLFTKLSSCWLIGSLLGWLTGLEPATPGTTIQGSSLLNYSHHELFVKHHAGP